MLCNMDNGIEAKSGVPTEIRTPVYSVKGSCPRPLDDGDLLQEAIELNEKRCKVNSLAKNIR